MQSELKNVEDYLASLSEDRRIALAAIRGAILEGIDGRFEEGMQYGMIGYYLPHSEYPKGYHCDPKQPLPFASLASQKRHIGLYLFCVYTDAEVQAWFVEEWKKTGMRLDMGKSCIRLRRLAEVPLELVTRLFKRVTAERFIASYEGARATQEAVKKKTPAKKKTRG